MSSSSDSLQLLLSFDKTVSWPETEKVASEALGFFNDEFTFDRISIGLLNKTDSYLDVFTSDESIPGLANRAQLAPEKANLSRAIPHYVADFSKAENLTSAESLVYKNGIQAYFYVPLLIDKSVMGSLNLGSKQVDGITEQARELVTLLSARLALALYHASLHDELKKNQQALIKSEGNYRDLIDQAGDAILKGKPNGDLVQANHAACQMFGYSQEEFLSLNYSALFSKNTLKQNPLRYDLLQLGHSVISERKIVRKDGTTLPIEMNSKKLEDGNLLTIIRDLTERNDSKEALIARENQISALLDAVPAPLYAKDNEGKYILLNDSYLKFFGRKKEDMIGKTVSQCWPEEIAKRFEEDDKLLLEKNERQAYSILLKNADGEERLNQVSKARYRNSQGEVAGFIGTLWDYTDLAAAEERYQNLFTFSPEPLVVHNGKVVLTANQAAIEFFGAKHPDDYFETPVADFIHPDSRPGALERIRDIFNSKKPNEPIHQKFLTSSGEVRDVEAKAIFVDYEGQPAVLTSFRDITKEKQNLALLEASEENYRNLIEANPNPVVVHVKQKLVYANKAALDFVGGDSIDDYMGIDVLSFVHKDSRSFTLESLARIENTKEASPPGDQRYLTATGEARNVESRAMPITYEGQDAVMVSFFDTTDKIEARQALQENRHQLELVTDHVTHFIILLDLDLNMQYANQASANWFGIKKADFIGKNLADIFTPEALDAARANLPGILDGNSCSFAFQYLSKAGNEFDFWVTMIPVLDANNEVLAILAQAEDVTKRVTARKELADNKELLELIIDTIPGLFSYTDTSERFLFVNQAYADWHQKDKTEIVGKHLKEVIPPDSLRLVQPQLRKALKGHEQSFSQSFEHKSGTTHVFDVRYIPRFDQNKQVIAFLSSFQDVTESKQGESREKALRELASSLTKEVSIHSVGVIAAKALRSVFESDAISVELYDNQNSTVVGVYTEDTFQGRSTPVEVKSLDIPYSDLSDVWFKEASLPHCINREEHDIKKGVKTIPFGDPRLSLSLLYVPIQWETEVIGVVSIQSYVPQKYSDADLPLLQIFVDQIGGALIRAQKEALLLEQRKTLEKEEKKYRSIIENAGDAVFVTSMKGEIHIANSTASESLGYSIDELCGMNLKEINPAFFKLLNQKTLAQLKHDGNSITIQSSHTRKDLSTFFVEIGVSITEINGKPNILCFAWDVSERKAFEMRERALRNLAHDLNASTDMRTVGQKAAKAIRSYFESDAFTIEYFDYKNAIVRGVYSEDTFEDGAPPQEVTATDSPFSKLSKTFFEANSKPHVRNRTPQQLESLKNNRPFGSGRFSHSLLFAPINWEGKHIGVLTVQSYTDNKYLDQDCPNVQTFADQIGGALVRTRKEEELKNRELQLETTLGEKEVLLKEVYHRTKNNMQVITGLLELHGYKTENKQTLAVLQEMINRITSMSMVHDLLFRSKNLTHIKLDVYLKRLVSRLVAAYQITSDEIALNFEIEAISVNIQVAIPLGLVINEIVSNSLKYAYQSSDNCQLSLFAKSQDKGLKLTISDNGSGVEQGFDLIKSDTLGMRIIRDIITLQLEGELKMVSKTGVEYQIYIPDLQFE